MCSPSPIFFSVSSSFDPLHIFVHVLPQPPMISVSSSLDPLHILASPSPTCFYLCLLSPDPLQIFAHVILNVLSICACFLSAGITGLYGTAVQLPAFPQLDVTGTNTTSPDCIFSPTSPLYTEVGVALWAWLRQSVGVALLISPWVWLC